ncbi:glycosyltransferase [Sphingomonas sp. DT-207]|uniref:glycosyltransferase n=1 Tax=Sphingomonas sp. DT-207 TaxID=3396167 RepID=UPI003F1DF863
MKILVLSALYPPYAFGGAEDCACSFAQWAGMQGHEVRVLMAAAKPGEVGAVSESEGVSVTMLATPHIYPVNAFDRAATWQKPIWHFQDHVADGAGRDVAAQVSAFAPDVIVIHYLQGFGYRTLAHLARCGVPVVYVLHDLGLACIRMSMFRNGRQCVGQCFACKVSGAYKTKLIEKLAAHTQVAFIAPSQAILDTLDQFVGLKRYPNARILNTKAYPVSQLPHVSGEFVRLLYVGKLDKSKGVDVLVAAVERLSSVHAVRLTVAGKGPLEQELRARYHNAPWLRLLGFVSQTDLADEMATSDLLCVPSLWQENSPGVVIQALGAGLPVAATDRGGLPELIEDGRNGILLRRHDISDWVERLTPLVTNRAALTQLRAQTQDDRTLFDIDVIGRKTIGFLATVAGQRAQAQEL